MKIVLATRSGDKLREIRQILRLPSRMQLLSVAELGLAETAEEELLEVHPTFSGNAVAKAAYFCRLTGLPAVADDSGLLVDYLEGAPGVRTKRFAADEAKATGTEPPESGGTDVANNELLLRKLKGVPAEHRSASYMCAAALVRPGGETTVALGTCAGRIAFSPAGQGGFGYDPLFLIPDLGLTFAQISAEQKDARSHRARAFRALQPALSALGT